MIYTTTSADRAGEGRERSEVMLTAKEYLERYQKDKEKIKVMVAEIEARESLVMSGALATDKVKVQTSVTSRQEEILAEVCDKQTELADLIADTLADLEEITTAIMMLSDKVQTQILTLRYISGKSWDEIAEITHFSRRAVFYTHERALDQVCTLLHLDA